MGRSIEYLQEKYKTKQPGEVFVSDRLKVEFGNANWRMAGKIRLCKYVMDELRIEGDNREVCINIIQSINLKDLHRTLPCESIITCICFYIKMLSNPKARLEDYHVCTEYNVNNENFSLVLVHLCNYFQKNSYLKF